MNFHCRNCRFDFRADSAQVCPRCYSKELVSEEKPKIKEGEKDAPREHQTGARDSRPIILGDTKGAWKSFHGNETKLCPQCSGVAFEFDWKHKEKTCKKCGSIFPLARRSS